MSEKEPQKFEKKHINNIVSALTVAGSLAFPGLVKANSPKGLVIEEFNTISQTSIISDAYLQDCYSISEDYYGNGLGIYNGCEITYEIGSVPWIKHLHEKYQIREITIDPMAVHNDLIELLYSESHWIPLGSETWKKRLGEIYRLSPGRLSEYELKKLEDGEMVTTYFIPPITAENEPTIAETLYLIGLVARRYGVPEKLAMAMAWQEGWDQGRDQHCRQWDSNGQVIKYLGNHGLFQINIGAHGEEFDFNEISVNMVANIEAGMTILCSKGRGDPDNLESWRNSVWNYNGSHLADLYVSKIYGMIAKPPENPESGKSAW
ncbi:MAG: hypothetical protein ACOX6V_05435 [Patescibacteria group bacterium]|jgi:hypothetical protein